MKKNWIISPKNVLVTKFPLQFLEESLKEKVLHCKCDLTILDLCVHRLEEHQENIKSYISSSFSAFWIFYTTYMLLSKGKILTRNMYKDNIEFAK